MSSLNSSQVPPIGRRRPSPDDTAPDGSEIKAQLGEAELETLDLTPGANLWVSWQPGAAHLLPGETG